MEEPIQQKQEQKTTPPVVIQYPPTQPGQGPPCIWDNFPTQRAGSCWACPNCGSSTSC